MLKYRLKNFLLCFLFANPALYAQTSEHDSLTFIADYETIYLLNQSRLKKWATNQKALDKNQENVLEIDDLRNEAQLFAESGDFETAALLLDTAIELTKLTKPNSLKKEMDFALTDQKAEKFDLTRQIISGMDLWQFRDAYAYQLESQSSEAALNPFGGLRILGNYRYTTASVFEIMSQLKVSKDYNNVELNLKHSYGRPDGYTLVVENRLEGTKEIRSFDSQYIGNTLLFDSRFNLNDQFNLSAGNDYRVRRYSGEDAFSDSYQQNRIFTTVQYNPSISTRAFGNYNYSTRSHDKIDSLDYFEHRFDLSLFYLTTENTSIFLENTWTRRNYYNNSSTASFFKSYQEEYILGDIKIGLSKRVALGVRSDFTLRFHDENTVVNENGAHNQANNEWTIPDYINFSGNPRLLFTIFSDWQLGVGYLYNLRLYRENILDSQPSVTSATTTALEYLQNDILFDDYYSHGISLSIELFRIDGLMISLTNQYQQKYFPNSPDIAGRLFNQDTRINSILLFSSWTINSKWEVNALVNYDDEQALYDEQSDMNNSFLSFDISYSF
ncbi:MAG: hypothetical protein DWQ10_06685 [Calditrichaeota bacterium]|nr:MAG: hypothetical protein DWQ10_06685 [Calditrichota bacterium]